MGNRVFTGGWPIARPPPGSRSVAKVALGRRQDALAKAAFFAQLSKRHLQSLAKVSQAFDFPTGAAIVEEGAVSSSFFVILEGQAKVVRKGRTVKRLMGGDFFGEISLLDPGPRTATVVAESNVRVLDLAGKDFLDVLADEPQLSIRILQELAKRLREVIVDSAGS
jgi:CRP/FNR family cyclic AMP-dependent transcriptional regulator